MSDLGVGSRDAVVLSGGLSELLGRPVPQVDFWRFPTIVFDYPTVEARTGCLATVLPELVEVADQESVDAYQGLTDERLLEELSERLG